MAFTKCGLPFSHFQYYQSYSEFHSDFNLLNKTKNCRNLNKILLISGNLGIERTKTGHNYFGKARTRIIFLLLTPEF